MEVGSEDTGVIVKPVTAIVTKVSDLSCGPCIM